MTVRELKWALADPNLNPDAEVRVVFHGQEQLSFNLPAQYTNGGVTASGVGFNIICEEAR